MTYRSVPFRGVVYCQNITRLSHILLLLQLTMISNVTITRHYLANTSHTLISYLLCLEAVAAAETANLASSLLYTVRPVHLSYCLVCLSACNKINAFITAVLCETRQHRCKRQADRQTRETEIYRYVTGAKLCEFCKVFTVLVLV